MTHKHLLRHILIASTLLATLSCATDLLPTGQEGDGSSPLTLWAEIEQLATTRVDDEGFAAVTRWACMWWTMRATSPAP